MQVGDTFVVNAIDRISRRAVGGLRFIMDVTDANDPSYRNSKANGHPYS